MLMCSLPPCVELRSHVTSHDWPASATLSFTNVASSELALAISALVNIALVSLALASADFATVASGS